MKGRKKHRPTAEAPDPPDADPAQAEAPSDLGALQSERDDLLARLQRVSADYLNYQKRIQKDNAQARLYANEALIKALLVVLDDMDRALETAAAHAADGDTLLEGMQLVRDKAMGTLAQFGLAPIEAVGQPFDPEHHSAVAQENTDAQPPDTVIRELQKGYTLKGRTIRPSMVVVTTLSDPTPPQEDPPHQEEE